MKKLILILTVLLMLAMPVNAEIFVYDSGTDVIVSWTEVDGALYYDVLVFNKSKNSSVSVPLTFSTQTILEGLIRHDIYYIEGRAYDNEGIFIESMGRAYFCFAVEDNSCTCICNCPEIPTHVYYGTIGPNWYTGVAICNANPESRVVLLHMNEITKAINIKSNSCITSMLRDLLGLEGIPIQNTSYAMTIETIEGVSLTLHTTDGTSFGMQ